MSREIKYIGMDVHKEAVVIAVQQHRELLAKSALRADDSPRSSGELELPQGVLAQFCRSTC